MLGWIRIYGHPCAGPAGPTRALASDTKSKKQKGSTVPAAYLERKHVRTASHHPEMAINIEHLGFVVLGSISNNDVKFRKSRFKRNMPAYESVLSGFKIKI